MRSEQEMFSLILLHRQRGRAHPAVYMNGSRTNPNARGISSRIMISFMW